MRTEIDRHLNEIGRILSGSDAKAAGLSSVLSEPLISDPLAWAAEARKIFGDRVQIFGFWAFENPQATVLGEIRERHDFAVLDRRWVMDGWVTKFYGDESPGIIDLSDDADLKRGAAIYGEPACWERDEDLERRADQSLRIDARPDDEPDDEPDIAIYDGQMRT